MKKNLLTWKKGNFVNKFIFFSQYQNRKLNLCINSTNKKKEFLYSPKSFSLFIHQRMGLFDFFIGKLHNSKFRNKFLIYWKWIGIHDVAYKMLYSFSPSHVNSIAVMSFHVNRAMPSSFKKNQYKNARKRFFNFPLPGFWYLHKFQPLYLFFWPWV